MFLLGGPSQLAPIAPLSAERTANNRGIRYFQRGIALEQRTRGHLLIWEIAIVRSIPRYVTELDKEFLRRRARVSRNSDFKKLEKVRADSGPLKRNRAFR